MTCPEGLKGCEDCPRYLDDIRQIEFYQDFVDKLMAENHYSDKDKTKERLYKLSLYVLDKMIDNPQFEAWNYVYDEIHKIRKAI